MAEYSASLQQTVAANAPIIFTDAPVPCRRGLVRHRDDSGNFLLSGYVPGNRRCNCGCGCQDTSANYLVDFGANIAVPTDGTVDSISVGIAIDGAVIPSSIMTVTPAAVEQFFNISRAINVQVWRGCCENVSIVNLSTQPILVQNANVLFSRPDLVYSR